MHRSTTQRKSLEGKVPDVYLSSTRRHNCGTLPVLHASSRPLAVGTEPLVVCFVDTTLVSPTANEPISMDPTVCLHKSPIKGKTENQN